MIIKTKLFLKMSFVKDRSIQSFDKSCWGRDTYRMFNFDSHEQMCLWEVEMMKQVREIYPYVPKVLDFDKDNLILTVEKIEGETIDKFKGDTEVIKKLKDAVDLFHSTEIEIKMDLKERDNKGRIYYIDYTEFNFIIDKDKNVWFIDWNISALGKEWTRSDDLRNLKDLLKQIE